MKSHFRALPPNNPRKVRGKKKVDVGEDDQNHTSSTRSTLTVLTDSAEVPMLVMRAPVRRREIVNQIGGAYIHHPSILEQSLVHSQIDATAFVTLTDPALYSGCRWIGIQEKYGLEKELCAKFFHLLMQLLDLWMEQPKQSNKVHNIIDTQGICLRDDREPSHTLSPDIFVQGTGPLFSPLPGTGKTPNWGSCVAIGDAKLNIARNKMDTFGQLGTYVAQIFSAQENRRFVPTFCFDNSRLLWCTFDRGGAVYGDAVDYHSDPWKLCALVLHFLFDGKDIGMDPSIRHDDDLTVISTTPPPEGSSGAAPSLHVPTASYVVRRTLFHSTNIRGSGTVYWLAQRRKPLNDSGIQKDDDSEHWCIIKDAWVVNGSERERTIYDRIHTSLTQGTRKGIAPLLFTHDVFFAGRLDSVSINRPRGVKTPVGENRVHTRAVFHATAGAKLLDHFSGEMELLVAVRDAIQGMLFQTSGIFQAHSRASIRPSQAT
jgi:hypothetical protein